MNIVHHLDLSPSYSGLDNRVYSMFKAGNSIGQKRYVCYTNIDAEVCFPFHDNSYFSITQKEAEEMPDAVHIIHRHMPPNFSKLKNTVHFSHGMPLYTCERAESIYAESEFLKKCDITLTHWREHIPYWERFTRKPIIHNQPGVDLDYFTEEGEKTPHENFVLYADTWRGNKNPFNLLFWAKNTDLKIKLLNIPEFKMEEVIALIRELGIEDRVIQPIEMIIIDPRPWYRSAEFVYSSSPEGNNVQWEATACGAKILFVSSELRHTIWSRAAPHDIKDTVRAQELIFKEHFNL